MNSAHYKQGVLQTTRVRKNVDVGLSTALACLFSPVVTALTIVIGIPAALLYVYGYLPYAWFTEREVDAPLHLENLPVIGGSGGGGGRHSAREEIVQSPVGRVDPSNQDYLDSRIV